MNAQKLNSAIAEFTKKTKSNAAYYEENWAERKERKDYYQSFTKDKLIAMTEEEFLEYISKLWSMLIWGNKKYVVDKLIADNGFATLKKHLAELLYGTNPIEKRWDIFLKSIKGMGPATISELLTYANPQEYVIFNKTTILCYGYLDIPDMPKYNYQYTGKKYAEVCAIAKKIAAELKKAGADDYDLLAVDYFMWDEILPLAEKKSPVSSATPEVKKPVTVKDSKSLHDEIKEKLVAIGELLGFDSRSEVKITTGAVVDAVWEAKIGNMGKAIYVFEVQSKGSIFAQQLFIVAVHLPEGVLRQLLGEPRHIVGTVPVLRRRIEFGENRPLLQISLHILFSDFIAPGFLTRPLAGYLAAFEKVQRRRLADVADAEELLLVHHLGNAIPVNGKYIHL